MPNLALLDLVAPYVLRGQNLGAQHAALSVLRVVAFDSAADDFGTVLRGSCEFNGKLKIDPLQGGLRISGNALVDEAAPAFDPNKRAPVFDIRETRVDFELFVPRAGSDIVAAGATSITATGFAGTRAVFDVWDTLPLDAPPSDYPASGFTLDLILNAPTLRPPFLHGAKLTAEGMLESDEDNFEVTLTLPKLRFRLSHGNANPSPLRFELVSAGATQLEDPADIGVAELITMQPPYAFIGDRNNRTLGIGFRSATLDLSAESTPAAILNKASVGDDWTGLYLPEVRVFFAPGGARDFAIEAGARELLIGFGDNDGFWGDFDAALVNQGSGELKLTARFIDAQGKQYGVEGNGDISNPSLGRARVPQRTLMVVDVSGGRAPYTRRAKVGAAAEAQGLSFAVDMAALATMEVRIRVTDTSATPITHTLIVQLDKRVQQASLPAPGTAPKPKLVATLDAPADTPVIVLVDQNDRNVVLATEPRDGAVEWAVDGGAFGAASASLTVEVLPGATHQVRARKPGAPAPSVLNFYFYFNEPAAGPDQARELDTLRAYAESERPGGQGHNVSNRLAVSKDLAQREAADEKAIDTHAALFQAAAAGSSVLIRGHASFEGDTGTPSKRKNYLLAQRRALAVREQIKSRFAGKNFNYTDITPVADATPVANLDAWANSPDFNSTGWANHKAPDDRSWWLTQVRLGGAVPTPAEDAQGTVRRPAAPPAPPVVIPPKDPPVPEPALPDWFRSARLKLRVVRSQLIAGEIEAEVDFETATEQRLRATGATGSSSPPKVHSLKNGTPVGPNNPADGITKFRLLCQSDPGTGRVTTLLSVGADPADKDGLLYAGWVPGEAMPANKDLGLTLVGSFLSFWPLLASAAEGGRGADVDAALPAASLVTAGVIAALPWFRVERIVMFGAEYLQRDRGGEFEGQLLFDVGIDWSLNILDGLIVVPRDHPLAIRYKAIGLRLGNRSDSGGAKWQLRPIFDSSRGYSIDIASGGALKIGEPLGQILRVLGARLSRTNPMTFEIDIGLGVDLGVVSVERASVRAYLDEPRPPELTALQAGVDIPGALVGKGYLEIKSETDAQGNKSSVIAGQLDLTLRPLSVRVAAAVAVATITDGPRTATGVYVGLNVVLPVGIPLANSGLGIFGFRGIFGMHYQRNDAIGAGTSVPALAWLKAAGGQPHLLAGPQGDVLWKPRIDRWSFGLGMLIGTMEGGVIMNMDGTLLLELPGPRVLIMMNARILMPPPSVGEVGMKGGVLAVIEVTPEHFMVGVLISWEVEKLIKIVIPVEAVFPFPPNLHKWHVYLGARKDLGQSIEVDVLGIVRGTGYLMFKGDGLQKFKTTGGELSEIQGMAIGVGVAASFTWGSTSAGLYLRVGGGMDAVVGFDPVIVHGIVYVAGELRLFIVSIGAYALLEVKVNEQEKLANQDRGGLQLYVHGKACGKVSFFFFDVEGCVDITIAGPQKSSPMPQLVEKVSLKSRTPALAAGSGVDKGIDVSLGQALERDAMPTLAELNAVVVPIDAIPTVSMRITPNVAPGLVIAGLGTAIGAPAGLLTGGIAERGGEQYRYTISAVSLERINPANGAVLTPTLDGPDAPAVWWTLREATQANANAQLALLTWEPTPATKAVEKTERLTQTVRDRWGTVCSPPCPAAEVLWTFRWERYGPSAVGWQLEGQAWPDPPGTRRSQAPDTGLKVQERWRSGDESLDGQRGIIPAFVVGSVVPCAKPPVAPGVPGVPAQPVLPVGPGLIARPQLLVGGRGPVADDARRDAGAAVDPADPVFAALASRRNGAQALRICPQLHAKVATALLLARSRTGSLDALWQHPQGLDTSALAMLARSEGQLGRAEAPALRAAANTRSCEARVLQAPVLDDGRIIVFGDKAAEEAVAQRLKKLGVSRGPLDDVVVLHIGAYATLDVLLLATREQFEKQQIVLRTLAANGQELERRVVTSADRTPPKPLPPRWADVSSPWADDITEILSWGEQRKLMAAAVRLIKGKEVARVEIGILHKDAPAGAVSPDTKQLEPPFFLGAVAALRNSELLRFEWDQQQIKSDLDVITQVLGPGASGNALMLPDSLYRLRVQWTGQRVNGGDSANDTQSFWFRTDHIGAPTGTPAVPRFESSAPMGVKLDPWMLATLPADHEAQVFYQVPPKLVFNTHDVDRIFRAYGKELRMRFQASSSRHPQAQNGVAHPLTIATPFLVPLKVALMSPWEEAVAEVLKGSCVPVDVDRIRHSSIDFPIPLEPHTDYILDVEMLPLGAAANATGPSIYRRHFSTGGFGTLASFAASVQGAEPSARYCAPGAFAAVAAAFAGRAPQGSELDEHLRAAGIEALGVPERARVVVFWSQVGAAAPQPEAVLIDATEPLWRSRPYPAKITDSTGPVDATRWVLQPTTWLSLQDGSGVGVLAANGLIAAPGLQRALVVLAPAARGKQVQIDLVSKGWPAELAFLGGTEARHTLFNLRLASAPWEEN